MGARPVGRFTVCGSRGWSAESNCVACVANTAARKYLDTHPFVGAFVGMFATDGCAKGGTVSSGTADPEQAAHPFRRFGGSFSVSASPRAYFGADVFKRSGVEGARPKEGDAGVVDYSAFYRWELRDSELVNALKCAPRRRLGAPCH